MIGVLGLQLRADAFRGAGGCPVLGGVQPVVGLGMDRIGFKGYYNMKGEFWQVA
ncbi:MAG: hypothetical protein KME26_11380 [Oscillatoria princeps RMCB-10]|nr:hypothetical protein [Oscillatoria princeps RMCB-10]